MPWAIGLYQETIARVCLRGPCQDVSPIVGLLEIVGLALSQALGLRLLLHGPIGAELGLEYVALGIVHG
jgi:hypothetical protein